MMDDVPDYRELDVGGEPGANKRRKSLDMDAGAGGGRGVTGDGERQPVSSIP